jgi:hypothetical protein
MRDDRGVMPVLRWSVLSGGHSADPLRIDGIAN